MEIIEYFYIENLYKRRMLWKKYFLKILVKNIDNKLIIYPFNISPHEWTHSETNKTYCE